MLFKLRNFITTFLSRILNLRFLRLGFVLKVEMHNRLNQTISKLRELYYKIVEISQILIVWRGLMQSLRHPYEEKWNILASVSDR